MQFFICWTSNVSPRSLSGEWTFSIKWNEEGNGARDEKSLTVSVESRIAAVRFVRHPDLHQCGHTAEANRWPRLR